MVNQEGESSKVIPALQVFVGFVASPVKPPEGLLEVFGCEIGFAHGASTPRCQTLHDCPRGVKGGDYLGQAIFRNCVDFELDMG